METGQEGRKWGWKEVNMAYAGPTGMSWLPVTDTWQASLTACLPSSCAEWWVTGE